MSVALVAMAPLVVDSNAVLRTAAEITAFHERKYNNNVPFELNGDIVNISNGSCVLNDATGNAWINTLADWPAKVGSRVRISGMARYDKLLETEVVVTSLVTIGKAEIRPPQDVEIRHIDDRRLNLETIRTKGLVADTFVDEIDPRFVIMLLKDKASFLPVSTDASKIPDLQTLIGAHVEVVGLFTRAMRGVRKYSGPFVVSSSYSVITPPLEDPFQAPVLRNIWYELTPSEIAALDLHTIRGTVLAAWGGSRLIVRDNCRRVVGVRLSHPTSLPSPGVTVDIVGYPQTDLYGINLSYAHWREASEQMQPREPAESIKDVSSTKILHKRDTYSPAGFEYHGELIRLKGVVRSMPDAASPEKRLYLNSDQYMVPVVFSSCPSVSDTVKIGSEIEVTGRCIVETSEWSPQNVFPVASGFFLVVRSAADFKVLHEPSWWTPARFVAALLVLLAALVAIFLWNLSLQVLVKRRARLIFKADLARVTSELRVEDRTRLAVELHDALSQNLTGVSMEIEAATRYGTEDPANLLRHLQVADKVLKSCRTELRNSLWDLRNQALEEHDINEAIRRTLLPHIKNVKLNVRFQVPRTRLTDNTTHEILHIIRELAVNGISHGGANEIRVAGSIENETLLFSVRDNGTGFDPDTVPGVLQGHFGLKGVQDRLRRLSGKLELSSVIGKGTRAAISIRLPQAQKKDSPS